LDFGGDASLKGETRKVQYTKDGSCVLAARTVLSSLPRWMKRRNEEESRSAGDGVEWWNAWIVFINVHVRI
jgi:hypothetical protein